MTGYDLDGVLTKGGFLPVEPFVIISGRTFQEYDHVCQSWARLAPLYIRGIGEYGDHVAAALFKSKIIKMLKLARFYEDNEVQARILQEEVGSFCDIRIVEK